ncbi:MAG: exo-alpha-sialidase [Planctomycetes bacterium]|nr:exo-alpha-sialidase [Planctomycetota bacterium]
MFSGMSLISRAIAETPAPAVVKNVVVYREEGRYAGWPANSGIWGWGNEIVVGFHLGYHLDREGKHPIDQSKPQVHRFARTLDGGETWKMEVPSYLDAEGREKPATPLTTSIDFQQPDFSLLLRMEDSDKGFSRFFWSNDRCRTWQGPFTFPTFERPGVMARTDVVFDGSQQATAFLTSARDEGGEGWPFAARTIDGGKTWKFVSWIGKQPGPGEYSIMPSTVRISATELLTYIRCRTRVDGKKNFKIEPYRSTDNGETWKLESQNTIDNGGNPTQMIKLQDGRLALTYGSRKAPFGIRARLSSDGGHTWSPDIMLRDDGGSWDLGYPRTIQRADGKIITAYYFNDTQHKERYIAATIWDAGTK